MTKKRFSTGAKVGITIGCIVVALFGVTVFCKMPGASAAAQVEPFTKAPIAHRGYFDNTSEAPENSLLAFQRAIDHGYCVELDTQLTADGTVVVLWENNRDLATITAVNSNSGIWACAMVLALAGLVLLAVKRNRFSKEQEEVK